LDNKNRISWLAARRGRRAHQSQAALQALKISPFRGSGYAKIDHHRLLRQWQRRGDLRRGQTAQQISGILRHDRPGGHNILITRLTRKSMPPWMWTRSWTITPRPGWHRRTPGDWRRGHVVVPPAAPATARGREGGPGGGDPGQPRHRLYDVGVAGCTACWGI
jgi:hypothetical protein